MKFSLLPGIARFVPLILIPSLSLGQPPAQGPGLPKPGNSKEFAVSIVLNGFEQTVQKVLDSANHRNDSLKSSTGVGAHLSFDYLAFKPYLTQTAYPDRPNENQVRMSLIVTYHITDISWHGVPYPSRNVSQSVDIYASCSGWSTGSGVPLIRFNGQQPYFDGNSFTEDAINFFCANLLSNYVDGAIRGQLSGFQSNIALSSPCNCIAARTPPEDTQANHYRESVFDFGFNPRSRIVVVSTGLLANSTETVTLSSVKRLPAHDGHGDVLYQPEENVSLILYVNQAVKVIPLGPMHENDVKTISDTKFSFPKPTSPDEMVVVIADIQQSDNVLTTNTQYDVYKKPINFGKGTQTLTVNKSYWQQPIRLPGRGNGGPTKPIQILVGAYALTLTVDYPNDAVLTQ